MKTTFNTMTPEELAGYAMTHNYSREQALNLIVRYHGDDEISDWAEIVEETYNRRIANLWKAYEIHGID
jgi:hypothetical protein